MRLDRVCRAARARLVRIYDLPLTQRIAAVARLQPREADFDEVFRAGAAAARRQYAALWGAAPVFSPERPARLEVRSARAGDLVRCVGVENLPAGYLAIAHLMRPGLAWTWWWTDGAAYDGLVRVGARWVWMPHPWLFLDDTAPATALAHFAE